MSKRIYAVTATRNLFLEDRHIITMILKREGLDDCEPDHDEMHHGNAEGGDKFLAALFTEWGYKVVPHNADWSKYGNAAGPIRNREMLDTSHPETLFAFPAKKSDQRPRSKGTVDCILAATERDIDVKSWWLI